MTVIAEGANTLSLWMARNPFMLIFIAVFAIIIYLVVWAYANNLF